MAERAEKKEGMKKRGRLRRFYDNMPHTENLILNVLFALVVPAITTVTLEWIARGTLGVHKQGNGFFQALEAHWASYLLSYLILLALYIFVSALVGTHRSGIIAVGLVGNIPAVVTYYKLTMRNEPFLPWDITQIGDLMGVQSSVSLDIQPNMIITLVILLALIGLSFFVRIPKGARGIAGMWPRLATAGVALAGGLVLLFAIFLNPKGTLAMGIKPDAWMQDRYYRNHGVITGFLTNLQMLNIEQPEGYSQAAVAELAGQTTGAAADREPFYEDSYAAAVGDEALQTPDIIFVMAESFWDVTALEGIEYDQPLLENLTALAAEGAYGQGISPSFGGGTCDVEFEVLTGYSMEFLPAGSKPFQQYITEDTFALPQVLKSRGYSTTAIHGYGRRFWNRDVAYPRLGIDTFVAADSFFNPEKRRGFISDNAMVDQIIEEYEKNRLDGPVFIHAVTMQNHTTYNPDQYPADELVRVTGHPEGIPESTIGQLECCATGIREMDAALGKLAEYLRTSARPTILVFWGDHMNPMSDGYRLFEQTGFIEEGETADPVLYQVPLLIWSNYAEDAVDLGKLALYNLTPVMMDLYGLEMPVFYEFLMQQMPVLRARNHGVTAGPDGSYSEELTEAQEKSLNDHNILQYDYLFGRRSLEDYLPDSSSFS